MGPLTRIAAAALALAGAAVAIVLVVAHDVPSSSAAPTQRLLVRTSFEPPAVQFGDRIVAHVVVLADRREVDAGAIRVTADLAPLSQLDRPRIEHADRGRLAVVTYDVAAVCIDDACLARSGAKELRLPVVRIDAGSTHARARWPLLEIRGRVTSADTASARPAFRADAVPPPVSYRIAPHTLATLLDVLAALLAAAAVAWSAWQAAALVRRRRSVDRRSALERALALVHEAESRAPEDRRRAVGLLARLLHREDATLARAASGLAWSEPRPEPEQLAALAAEVEGRGDGA